MLKRDWPDLETPLGRLDYPGYAYMGDGDAQPDDAFRVIAESVTQPEYSPRVAVAIPWVLRHYATSIDWDRLTETVLASGFINRLGFMVELAIEADSREKADPAMREVLLVQLRRLQAMRTGEEHTCCSSDAELEFCKKWRASKPNPLAARWGICTSTDVAELSHV